LFCPFYLYPVDIIEPQRSNARHPPSLKKATFLKQRQRFDDHPSGLNMLLCHDHILGVTHSLWLSVYFSYSYHWDFALNLVGCCDSALFPMVPVVFGRASTVMYGKCF